MTIHDIYTISVQLPINTQYSITYIAQSIVDCAVMKMMASWYCIMDARDTAVCSECLQLGKPRRWTRNKHHQNMRKQALLYIISKHFYLFFNTSMNWEVSSGEMCLELNPSIRVSCTPWRTWSWASWAWCGSESWSGRQWRTPWSPPRPGWCQSGVSKQECQMIL